MADAKLSTPISIAVITAEGEFGLIPMAKQLTPEETTLLAKVQKALADNGDWLSDTIR